MKPTYKNYLIVTALLLCAIAILYFFDLTTKVDETPLNLSLPETIGEYTASDIFFCQNPDCMKSGTPEMLIGNKCPFCGGEVDKASPPEKRMLPEDTVILRKVYKPAGGMDTITASIIISGAQYTSIHRPQMCLPGQGYQILRQYTRPIAISEDRSFKVTILDLRLAHDTKSEFVFAYWFVAPNHQTPYHIERLFVTAMDNIFKGTSPQWAYISVMTRKSEDTTLINEFLADIYLHNLPDTH